MLAPRTVDKLKRAYQRAVEDGLKVYELEAGELFSVPSVKTTGQEYYVMVTGPHWMNLTCTCPCGSLGEEGAVCKHMVAVMYARRHKVVLPYTEYPHSSWVVGHGPRTGQATL